MARRSKVVQTEDAPPSYNPATEIVTDLAESTALPESTAEPEPQKSRMPDPHPYARINLGDDQSMRLWRNERKAELAITFTEKPEPQYTQMLKEAGFRWRGEDKAWVKPMDRDQKWRATADAEKAFHAVGDAIREAKGLNAEQGVA